MSLSRRACALAAPLLALLAAGTAASACALDQVPSISLDGRLAVVNTHPPATSRALRTWAPFVFPLAPRPGQALRFAENRREVARSLTRQAMQHAAKWEFGDGTRAYGWTVWHSYRRAGTYRITTLAYDRGSHRWYPFDEALVTVRGK